MTVLMRVVDRLLRLQPNKLRDRDTAAAIAERPRSCAPLPKGLRRAAHLSEGTLRGHTLITLTPREGGRDVTVVYVHGGAYVNEMFAAHWSIIRNMTKGTGATIEVPLYGLAPQHSVDEAFALLEALITTIRRDRPADQIFLAGDSAGGGLCLAFTLEHREDDLRPAGLILLSPWVDVRMENPQARRMEKTDAMLGVDGLRYWGERWAGARALSDPRVSPALGDLHDLPPTWVYQGGRDLFLPDVQAFAAAAHAAASPVFLRVIPDGFHVFVGLGIAGESRAVFHEVRDTLTRRPAAS